MSDFLKTSSLVFRDDKKTLLECTDKEITQVVIPDGVTEIGASAFSNCTYLTSVVIPDSVTKIGFWAFGNCPCEKELKKKYPHLF